MNGALVPLRRADGAPHLQILRRVLGEESKP
jgi:hypothetical protein